MNIIKIRKHLILFSLFLTLGVILLGAYTRLVDAGLGCPDWPGCYGLWRTPLSQSEILNAQSAFPMTPVDAFKAQTEMFHRYFASTLGLVILIITALTFLKPHTLKQKILALSLTALVIFQGLLGMWTVTLKLLPVIVMSHLLGGLLLLSLLWCAWHSQKKHPIIVVNLFTRRLAALALIVVIIQIALGGWTSTNYAALSCPDFPLCQNQWWPSMSAQGFDLIGAFKHLDNPLSYMTLEARTAIHMAHRIGALITSLILLILIPALWHAKARCFVLLISGLFVLQILLGITNVLALLPLGIALAHNGIATLLLLTLISLQFYLKSGPIPANAKLSRTV